MFPRQTKHTETVFIGEWSNVAASRETKQAMLQRASASRGRRACATPRRMNSTDGSQRLRVHRRILGRQRSFVPNQPIRHGTRQFCGHLARSERRLRNLRISVSTNMKQGGSRKRHNECEGPIHRYFLFHDVVSDRWASERTDALCPVEMIRIWPTRKNPIRGDTLLRFG
jgi:hypothetical protein